MNYTSWDPVEQSLMAAHQSRNITTRSVHMRGENKKRHPSLSDNFALFYGMCKGKGTDKSSLDRLRGLNSNNV